MTIPFGYYETMYDIVNALNESISENMPVSSIPIPDKNGSFVMTKVERDKWPRFKYNEVKRKVNVHLVPGAMMTFDDYLAHMLGIRVQPVVNRGLNGSGIGGTMTSDITGGISSLYVYTDILEPVAVGDTEAQLLRVVDVKGRNGETVHKTFDHLHYVPIQKKRFDTIEVDIRDDTGAPISFETGRLIATLHIRRASHPYFSS
jgi:hypothetical protein